MDPVRDPSACSASVFRSPSQRRLGWPSELKIVGDWRGVGLPAASIDAGSGSAPQCEDGWQEAHATFPFSETAVSQNRARPRRSMVSG
jgi:hypothetical protein